MNKNQKTANSVVNEEYLYLKMQAAKQILFDNVNRMKKRWTYRTDITQLHNMMYWAKYGELIATLLLQHESKTREETIQAIYTIMHCSDKLGYDYERKVKVK